MLNNFIIVKIYINCMTVNGLIKMKLFYPKKWKIRVFLKNFLTFLVKLFFLVIFVVFKIY